MERRNWLVIVAALMIVPLAGCGGAESPAPTARAISAATPDKAVHQFLEAVRVGNDSTASQMLTKLAREKTAEMQLVVAPPGSETAKFSVGEVEFIGDAGAHVASTWTDIVEDGQPHTDTIVWILRKEPEGWRIAGMGTKLFDDAPPLLLNFEDPEDMIRKQRMAEEEMARRSQPAGGQVAGTQAVGNQPLANQPAGGQAMVNQPIANQPGGQPLGNQPQAGQPAASQAQKLTTPPLQPDRK